MPSTPDLSGCVTGPADHFERRAFSQTLLELLEEHQHQLPRGRTVQDAFFFFESLVQGMMATWCFTGGTTTALESGKRMIEDSVASFWARSRFTFRPKNSPGSSFKEPPGEFFYRIVPKQTTAVPDKHSVCQNG